MQLAPVDTSGMTEQERLSYDMRPTVLWSMLELAASKSEGGGTWEWSGTKWIRKLKGRASYPGASYWRATEKSIQALDLALGVWTIVAERSEGPLDIALAEWRGDGDWALGDLDTGGEPQGVGSSEPATGEIYTLLKREGAGKLVAEWVDESSHQGNALLVMGNPLPPTPHGERATIVSTRDPSALAGAPAAYWVLRETDWGTSTTSARTVALAAGAGVLALLAALWIRR